MTKKHFEMIASAIRWELGLATNNPDRRLDVLYTARQLADRFSREYPKFKSREFLKKCGDTA